MAVQAISNWHPHTAATEHDNRIWADFWLERVNRFERVFMRPRVSIAVRKCIPGHCGGLKIWTQFCQIAVLRLGFHQLCKGRNDDDMPPRRPFIDPTVRKGGCPLGRVRIHHSQGGINCCLTIWGDFTDDLG